MKVGRIHISALFLLLVPACTSMPPKVYNAKDALRLSPDSTGISARGLADEDMRSLFRFPEVEFLSFGIGTLDTDAKISDRGLVILAEESWPALRCLQLDMNWNITDRGIEALARADMPVLQILVLAENPNITDEGLKHLASMRQVTNLNLSLLPRITDRGLKYLSEAPQITWLALDECDGITDEGVSYLMEMPNLRFVHLGGCKQVLRNWEELYPGKVSMKLYPYTGAGAEEERALKDKIRRLGAVSIE